MRSKLTLYFYLELVAGDSGLGSNVLQTIMSLLKQQDPDLDTIDARVPIVDTIALVHSSKEIYASFVALCGNCVVHHTKYKSKACIGTDLNWFTVDDEALSMLILENCVHKWNSEYTIRRSLNQEQNDGVVHLDAVLAMKMSREIKQTLPRTKFTERSEGEGNIGGWSVEGVERFKVLKLHVKQVRADEARWGDYEDHAAIEIRKTFYKKNVTNKRKRINSETVNGPTIYNDKELSIFSSGVDMLSYDDVQQTEL